MGQIDDEINRLSTFGQLQLLTMPRPMGKAAYFVQWGGAFHHAELLLTVEIPVGQSLRCPPVLEAWRDQWGSGVGAVRLIGTERPS